MSFTGTVKREVTSLKVTETAKIALLSAFFRNNYQIPLYCGEMIKIKTNDYLTHFVKPTETIESISNKYDLSIEKLIRDNGLKNTKLFIGQRIKIYKED